MNSAYFVAAAAVALLWLQWLARGLRAAEEQGLVLLQVGEAGGDQAGSLMVKRRGRGTWRMFPRSAGSRLDGR